MTWEKDPIIFRLVCQAPNSCLCLFARFPLSLCLRPRGALVFAAWGRCERRPRCAIGVTADNLGWIAWTDHLLTPESSHLARRLYRSVENYHLRPAQWRLAIQNFRWQAVVFRSHQLSQKLAPRFNGTPTLPVVVVSWPSRGVRSTHLDFEGQMRAGYRYTPQKTWSNRYFHS